MDSFLYDFQEGYFDYVNTLSHGKLFDASKEIIDYNINALKEKINGMPHDTDALFEILDGLDPDATDECYQQFLTDFKFCKTLDDVDAKLGAFKMHVKKINSNVNQYIQKLIYQQFMVLKVREVK